MRTINYVMAIKFISIDKARQVKSALLSQNAPEHIKTGKDWRMTNGIDPNDKHSQSEKLVSALKQYHEALKIINSILD